MFAWSVVIFPPLAHYFHIFQLLYYINLTIFPLSFFWGIVIFHKIFFFWALFVEFFSRFSVVSNEMKFSPSRPLKICANCFYWFLSFRQHTNSRRRRRRSVLLSLLKLPVRTLTRLLPLSQFDIYLWALRNFCSLVCSFTPSVRYVRRIKFSLFWIMSFGEIFMTVAMP